MTAVAAALTVTGAQPMAASLYEGFTLAEYPSKSAMESFVFSSPFIFYMTPPSFPTIRHYWHTPGASTDIRVGMAEFSSQNYVSSGSLFKVSTWPFSSTDLSSPSQLFVPLPNGQDTSLVTRSVNVTYADGSAASGDIQFVVGAVRDDYNGQQYPNRALATLSLVTKPSLVVPIQREVSINREVFKEMHEVLLPRAVMFSAGVIDHFFSGKLGIQRTPDESNSWQVSNHSGKTMSGTFSILFESDTGMRSQYAAKAATLGSGAKVEIVSPEPPESTTTKVIVVFEGSLGEEQNYASGIAGAKVADFTPAAEEPISCGTPISAAGSSEGLSVPVIELGTTPGEVQLEFQAYHIPDAIELHANNAAQTELASSNGFVQGYHLYEINYDPMVLGTTTVNLTVDGNEDMGTLWNATLGCPGQVLDNGDRPDPLVPVTFQYGGSDNGNSIGTCNFDLYIDGQYRNHVNTGSFGMTFTLTLTAGTHQFEYRNKSCQQRATTGGFRSNYTDGAGTHSIVNPYFSGQVIGLFTVASP